MPRPACPRCGTRTIRPQDSYGVIAVYPCGCWLTPAQARTHLGQPDARQETR